MPTPVTTARQCLTPEAAQALDDAVSVACRRSHTQTSSLHAISALLSLPSSPLREACRRVRNSAYTSRVQFKALELCLGVSLDRLQSSPQRVGEPPVSNSLMAAIKRSQANQRRQPENFHLYQQTASFPPSCASVSTVKVELQNLILSILDDPVVSRVFGESGFRSSDIKLSILRPVHHQLFRYKGPPVFLCNLTNDFGFPFRGILDHDESSKRIIETLARKHGEKGNNPLLIGASAIDALKNFLETLQKRKSGGFFPPELSDLTVTSVKDEIFDFVNGNSDVGSLKLRLEEVGNLLKQSTGSGVIVEFGDLKVLIGQNSSVDVEIVVRELCDLLKVHGGRVWLIGTAENHEIYSEFCKIFPLVEKDLGLHVLPISSIKSRMAETFPKSSLMESFVPFGGFFSMPSDITSPLSVSNRYGSLCRLCDDKFKREVDALADGGLVSSVCDGYGSTLPSWLHASGGMEMVKAPDEPVVLTAKVIGLQRKWAKICQHLHRAEHYTQIGFQVKLHSLSTESQCNTIPKSNLNDTTSPVSGNSVTTDLGLGVNRPPRISETATVKSSSSFPVSRGRFPQKDYKTLCSSLFTKVGRQEEAISVVSRTINGGRQGGIWFAFVGPDRFAKKKLAVALAEVLYGSEGNVIRVDLSGRGFIDGCDQRLRGKNIVDFVADELRKKQLSVVFLENIDMADTLTQHHLSRAVSTRRFCDSHGREVGVSNAIFVLTSRFSGNLDLEGADSAEENVLNVRKPKSRTIHMLTGFDLGDGKRRRKVVNVTKSQHKRKLVDTADAAKRAYLDLNLPAGETDSAPENGWLRDFLKRVDEKVVFEPFDFERLSEKLLGRIGECFEKVIGFDCLLEIDSEVMEQIVGAAFCVETEKVEEWIEGVLGKAFEAGRRKYSLGAHSFVKLVGCEAPEEEGEESAGVFLPGRVTMN